MSRAYAEIAEQSQYWISVACSLFCAPHPAGTAHLCMYMEDTEHVTWGCIALAFMLHVNMDDCMPEAFFALTTLQTLPPTLNLT